MFTEGRILRVFGWMMLVPGWLISYGQAYDAELVSQRTDIEVVGGTLVKTYFYKIIINNRSGERFSKFTIPYSKLEKVSNIEAYITDAKGARIRKLEKNEIKDRSSISDYSLYEDDYVKEFTLKYDTYPYTIVYSYESRQSEFLYLDYWSPVLDERIPTQSAVLTLTVPADYKFSYRNQFVDEPSVINTGDQLRYKWEARYMEPLMREVLSPAMITQLPFVICVPDDFRFDMPGSFASWASYGDWQYSLLPGLQDLPETEKNKIVNFTKDATDAREKIRILYHLLQDETRYINISIETGGMKPYPASQVAVNKYGDCKALTNYFKAQLDCLGIPSFYTNVRAGQPIVPIRREFPSQQFNHAILYVPLGQDTLWLDCTSDGPFNYLGTFCQGRDAFVVEKGSSDFKMTPALQPSDVLESRHIRISSPSGQGSSVTFNARYKGKMFELLNDLEKSYGEVDKFNYFRDQITERGHQLKKYTIEEHHRDSVFMKVTLETVALDMYTAYSKELLLSNIPFALPSLEKPSERKLPVQLDYPVAKLDTLEYEIPSGYRVYQMGTEQLIASPYGQYQVKFEQTDSVVLVIKRLTLFAGYYPPSAYQSLYTFISSIDRAERKKQIVLAKQN